MLTKDNCDQCHNVSAPRNIQQTSYRDHLIRCFRCGALTHHDLCTFFDTDKDEIMPLCPDCYAGESETHLIHRYGYKPNPIFRGDGPRYYGVELEIDDGGQYQHAVGVLLETANRDEEYIYIKSDRSLKNGMELVSHPADFSVHQNKIPWREIMRVARDLGYTSHNAGTCGLHIHVNRDSFGATAQEQESNIARLLFLTEKYWDNMLIISRRTQEQMEKWCKPYGGGETPQEVLRIAKSTSDRYFCVNLRNLNTIEYRLFRGTLRWGTFIAALQLVDALCDTAIHYTDAQLQAMNWDDFLRRLTGYPELIEYLKRMDLYGIAPASADAEEKA